MFFDPSGEDRLEYDSSGCFFLVPRSLEPSRMAYYKGYEVRGFDVVGGREPDVREFDLYPPTQLPSEYMPSFAVLDLDNTLFDGWSVIDWADNNVYMHGLAGLAELRASLLEGREAYKADTVSHDEFAASAGDAYAEFFDQNGPTALRQAASAFAGEASTQDRFFGFATDLVQALRQRLIAPVLITGAPQELANELGSVLGITEVHGFDVARRDQPHPGTAEGKMHLAHLIARETARSLQFAAGDSESDEPVLAASPARMVASGLIQRRPALKNTGKTFEFTKTTPARLLTDWVKDVLPNPSLSQQNS